jgi:hypothetical protein
MTDFAAAIKKAGVAKEDHRAAMEYVIEEEMYGRKMASAINLWWYRVSGQQERDMRRAQKEEVMRKLRKHYTWPSRNRPHPERSGCRVVPAPTGAGKGRARPPRRTGRRRERPTVRRPAGCHLCAVAGFATRFIPGPARPLAQI